MEDEAFFLWIKYRINSLPITVDENGHERINYVPVIRAAVLRKDENAEVQYKRVHVDFDPTSRQSAFVVVIHAEMDSGVYREYFYFPAITETLEQAQEEKRKIEDGGYRAFMAKKQKMHKVEIVPVVIAAI